MPTWTQKQIAALSGLDKDIYNALVKEQGYRPADALNAVRGIQQGVASDAAQGKQEALGGAGAGNVPDKTPDKPATLLTPPETTAKTPTYQKNVYLSGGMVETRQYYSDGTFDTIEQFKDMTAADAALAMFKNLGLGDAFTSSLMATIEGVYTKSVKPTEGEVLNAIYNSDAYKTRFKANETIKARMASGKGLAGDKLLTPAEYIELEKTYREYMTNVGLPTNFYDQPEDFSNFIANGVSPAEVKSRIDLAGEALNKADVNIVNALRDYYGLSREDLVAYLVDPNKATNLFDQRNTYTNLAKAYGAAEVGGAARRQGFTSGDVLSDRLLSEEIVQQGKTAEAEKAFQTAATMQPDLQRLGQLYNEYTDAQDLVREQLALEGGVAAGQKRRKLASKERAMFSQQSAVGKASLSKQASL